MGTTEPQWVRNRLLEPARQNSTQNPLRWFFIALVLFLPLHISAVVIDVWFVLPPKPIGDGPDYEAIGFGLSQGYGWSTSFSDPEWRRAYEDVQDPNVGLDYSVQLARRGPIVADTNRPPLFPAFIAMVYRLVPRGPIAFGFIRVALACSLSIGCALAVAWGVAIVSPMKQFKGSLVPSIVGVSVIAIVYSERNLRNYTTDFLTEPFSLLLTQAFLIVAWYGTQNGNWKWAAATGAIFAGMYFCRGVFVLWVPFVAIWLLALAWATGPRSTRPGGPCYGLLNPLRWVLLCMLTFGLLSSIWWVRNCIVLESFHPLGTKGSTTLMGGYCDESYQSDGLWQFAPERELRFELESKLDWNKTSAKDLRDLELEIERQAKFKVNQWSSENFERLPALVVKRVITEWNPYQGKALIIKLLALIGVVWLIRYNRLGLIWLVGPLVINTVIVAMTYSIGGRFLVPTYGPIYIFAAFGVAGIVDVLNRFTPLDRLTPSHRQRLAADTSLKET